MDPPQHFWYVCITFLVLRHWDGKTIGWNDPHGLATNYGEKIFSTEGTGKYFEVLDEVNTHVMKVCQTWKGKKQGHDIARSICNLLIKKLGSILLLATSQKEMLVAQMKRKSKPNLKISKRFDTTMKTLLNSKRRNVTLDDLNFFLNGICPMVKRSGVLLDGITREMCIRAILSFQPVLSFNLTNPNYSLYK